MVLLDTEIAEREEIAEGGERSNGSALNLRPSAQSLFPLRISPSALSPVSAISAFTRKRSDWIDGRSVADQDIRAFAALRKRAWAAAVTRPWDGFLSFTGTLRTVG